MKCGGRTEHAGEEHMDVINTSVGSNLCTFVSQKFILYFPWPSTYGMYKYQYGRDKYWGIHYANIYTFVTVDFHVMFKEVTQLACGL